VTRRLPALAAHGLLAAFLAPLAWWRLFTFFAPYDDEGYLLLSLRSFIHGGALYDQVYTQYGPFYYEFWGGLLGLTGQAVTTNVGRLLVVGVWVLTSLLLGIAASRATRSLAAGLCAQIVSFSVLDGLVPEPMHPSGLIVLLLSAFAVALTVLPQRARAGAGALGAIAAAATLTKLNVGGLLVIGIAWSLVVAWPRARRQRWVVAAATALLALVPVVLMRQDLGYAPIGRYAAVVALALLAVGVAALPGQVVDAARLRLIARWFAVGLAATAALVTVVLLILGTTPGALFDGVVTEPLRLRNIFSITLLTVPRDLVWAITGAGAAAGWVLVRTRPASRLVAGAGALARIAAAVAAFMAATGWIASRR
jgi:hypothetical protein